MQDGAGAGGYRYVVGGPDGGCYEGGRGGDRACCV